MDPELTVDLKEYLLALLNEREQRVRREFLHIEERLREAQQSVKEALLLANQNMKDALTLANQNTKEALETANSNIVAFSQSIDARFTSINDFRGQITDQLTLLARKDDIALQIQYSKEAVDKAERATEKRFDSVNEFREQMADMQTTLIRKSEVDIRFDAFTTQLKDADHRTDLRFDSLEKKLDNAVAQQQIAEGRRLGIMIAWGAFLAIIGLAITFLFHH
jgi:uncharacterized membrane protein